MKNMADLIGIVRDLRNPNGGCPWDIAQTHESLKKHMIEEAYEVVDAIDQDSGLLGELGDVLLQVLLHSQIAAEKNSFSIDDVINHLATKLIERHPHVFGPEKAANEKEAVESWEKAKASKKADKNESIMHGIPRSLPGLSRAQKMGERAARAQFDWPDVLGVHEKILEEISEFSAACATQCLKDTGEKMDEFGDILFTLAQLARKLGFQAEEALDRSVRKFESRFKEMERILSGRPLNELPMETKQKAWETAKTTTNTSLK